MVKRRLGKCKWCHGDVAEIEWSGGSMIVHCWFYKDGTYNAYLQLHKPAPINTDNIEFNNLIDTYYGGNEV